MLAAAPGIGKSSVAVDIAIKTKRPTLYLCADSAELTIASRVGASLTGRYLFDVEQEILRNPKWASEVMAQADHIRWGFDSELTFEDISEEVEAFEEVWGEAPHLIVVDNVTDVVDDGGDEFSALRKTMRGLKFLARSTNASVLGLHHTSESFDSNPCPPKRAVHGKINQVPALILTLGPPQQGYLPVACVKNRQGPADLSGQTAMWLAFDPSVMRLSDPGR